MINVLVVDDNFYFSKKLINIISTSIPKVRLYNFCTNGKEAIDLIKNDINQIDIILLDLNIPQYNGIKILNYIEKNNLIKYKNSIIIISGEIDMILSLKNNSYLYTIVSKSSGYNKIIEELNSLIHIKEEEKIPIDYKVHKELENLHFNFSYLGTKYIEESILFLYENKYNDIKLEKKVYPVIAERYNTTINNVKTNIINSCNLMYYDCDFYLINKYFGSVDNEKPTPKFIITMILNKLKFGDYYF